MRILSVGEAERRLAWSDPSRAPAVIRKVRRIVEDVRRNGDRAVARWARVLDSASGSFDVTPRELRAGWDATPRDVRQAIRVAARNVRRVSERQRARPFSIEVTPGVRIEQRVVPLRRIACYVPGGRHPLPSTVVMSVVPAVVAGVREIAVFCPRPAPAVLAAALESGAPTVYRLGGAQAIAAAAYGTATIRPVEKIVGPGNAWVTAAKEMVATDCAIDFRAGPTEILIWSDEGNPRWIAADLLAQAEHDPHARAIFVSRNPRLAARVAAEVQSAKRGEGIVLVVSARNRQEVRAFVARVAPEHLVCDSREDAAGLPAGTVFVGRWSAPALGDYCTGSNHVLPTGGVARARGGLSAADFVRVFTQQVISRRGLGAIGPSAVVLARAEGLDAHARSILVRLERSPGRRTR